MTSENFKKQFDRVKFIVSPELSKRVQEKLFTLGYVWAHDKSRDIKCLDSPFLFLDMCMGYNESYVSRLPNTLSDDYLRHPYREVTASEILNAKVEDTYRIKGTIEAVVSSNKGKEDAVRRFCHFLRETAEKGDFECVGITIKPE